MRWGVQRTGEKKIVGANTHTGVQNCRISGHKAMNVPAVL